MNSFTVTCLLAALFALMPQSYAAITDIPAAEEPATTLRDAPAEEESATTIRYAAELAESVATQEIDCAAIKQNIHDAFASHFPELQEILRITVEPKGNSKPLADLQQEFHDLVMDMVNKQHQYKCK